MPLRRKRTRSGNISPHDIEALRGAIHEGYPWILHSTDNVFRVTGLTTMQNILLSYATGIAAGAAIFLSGEDHPSKEAVAAVKAELKSEIAEAEARCKSIFIRERHRDGYFRDVGPPSRSEF